MSSTVIGNELVISGSVTSQEDIQLDGTVHGPLTSSAHVAIGARGLVDAAVSGRTVSVSGTVSASVTATERVDLLEGGRLIGDVKAPRLTIADGATFRGKVDMET